MQPTNETHPMRRLDRKLQAIRSGAATSDDFILADAKDADMAFGVTAAGAADGTRPERAKPGHYRTRPDYLAGMRALIEQGELDILLTSASNGERMAREGAIADDLTLAVRGNDSTDIWLPRGSSYDASPSRPFRTVELAAIAPFCDLVLYSITLNNDLELDLATLQAYRDFRTEAADHGVRHFLEVFDPNAPVSLAGVDRGAFINDSIVRILAGVTEAHRPRFLKIAYNGGAALAELTEHDPTLPVGILGGAAGTTRDAFELLSRAYAHGAWISLFGRRIQRAESQLDLVALLRPVIRGDLDPEGAVRAYHAALASVDIAPHRELSADLELTHPVLLAE